MFTSRKQFYNSKEWESLIQKLRFERMHNDGITYCEECGKAIHQKYDCIGHHIEELNEMNVNDYLVSLNPNNVMLVHFKCHNKIHNRFGNCKHNVYLVYGAPRSGKTTWVLDNASKDDLILDIDKIWQMISINAMHEKPNKLITPVFAIKDKIYDIIRTRTGKWDNAFIIGGYPLAGERERIINETGAIPIYIEQMKEVCIKRARKENINILNQYITYIDEWFERYQTG